MKVENRALQILLPVLLTCALAQGGAYAAETATAPVAVPRAATADALRAQALLKKAVAHYGARKDRAFPDFNQGPQFVDGELYVYVVSSVTGVMLASGGPSFALVNQNVTELEDATGKAFFQEMFSKAKTSTSGTVEYLWLNRVDNKEETKVAFFQKVDDRIIAVGYYKR
jgi:cytochrome c